MAPRNGNESTKTGNASKFRQPLRPKAILNRKELSRSLESAGISLKKNQLDVFYYELHLQNYPPLPKFVEAYYSQFITPTQASKHRRQKVQLPKAFLQYLANTKDFITLTSHVSSIYNSTDGETTKLLLRLQDDHLIECVLMRYRGRVSLCVSSQVGCAMGCTFCATGTMGIRGNLCAGEIVEQMVHASTYLMQKEKNSVRNVVFMGMGEPLNNYKNVVAACRAFMDKRRWNLKHGRITVSTVGIAPKIRDLARDLNEVSLAFSLHAPNQKMREEIVPMAKYYPLDDIMSALDEFCSQDPARKPTKQKKAMIEYVMLTGPTSSTKCAHQLGQLSQNRHLVVNLIPYNPTSTKDAHSCPSDAHIKNFQDIVTSYGVLCIVRRTMGTDIAGACGQLVVDIEDMQKKEIKDGLKHSVVVEYPKKNVGKDTTPKEKEGVKPHESNTTDLEKWIRPLTYATIISASTFLLSTALFLMKSGKRGNRR